MIHHDEDENEDEDVSLLLLLCLQDPEVLMERHQAEHVKELLRRTPAPRYTCVHQKIHIIRGDVFQTSILVLFRYRFYV